MPRLFGVDLPREKRIETGLTYIYGIGDTSAKKIIAATGVNPDIRVKDISEDDLQKIREYIDQNMTIEGDLHREVSQWPAPPQGPSRSRPAHAHQRPHPQGSQASNRRQEEIRGLTHG